VQAFTALLVHGVAGGVVRTVVRRPLPAPSPQGQARPVFVDASGRRWRRLRRFAAVAIVLIVAVAGFVWWQVTSIPRQVATKPSLTADLDVRRPTVVVGSGPLVRVLKLATGSGRVYGFDAVTGASVGELTGQDATRATGHEFVMQRYGYRANAKKVICLTFDDGPSLEYTPALLDLLSREHVPVTFFDIGDEMVQHPDLVAREGREGHLVANHTMTHVQISAVQQWRVQAELVSTDRSIRALTGTQTPLFRLPYEGDDEQSTQESLAGVLWAQRLGYVVASHDYDSLDWLHAGHPNLGPIPLPKLDGSNLTVLLHDGGGNRHLTVAYVARLIAAAKAAGYTFETMAAAQQGLAPASGTVQVTADDRIALWSATVVYAWPVEVLDVLFGLALVAAAQSLLYSAIAILRRFRRRRRQYPEPDTWRLTVSVVLAAYNEAAVIGRTLEHILASDVPLVDVVVVDDGSTDGTGDIVSDLASTDPRVRLIRQPNTGKAGALNHGLQVAKGDVIVTLDADTVVQPSTVRNLVRHFALDDRDRRSDLNGQDVEAERRRGGPVGAVAGTVRVGNRTRNLLTRWQALEYLTQISVDRSAQDALGAIVIVPGACAAWRREAILAVGGYSDRTLAEDCHLTLAVHRAGWRVTQDDEAYAFTEAPEDVDGLLKQRVRWSYGTLQAIHLHRDMVLRPRYGWLGMWALPNYALSIVMPLLFLPLTTVMAFLMVQQQGWAPLAVYAAVFAAAHVAVAAVAVALSGESPRHLLMVPVYRLVFEPLRAYLIYTSAFMALRGVNALWNKLARTGSMDEDVAPTTPPAPPPVLIVLPADGEDAVRAVHCPEPTS
jgi:biofilm PGA synthesis N-glycosyltransferase PgaC